MVLSPECALERAREIAEEAHLGQSSKTALYRSRSSRCRAGGWPRRDHRRLAARRCGKKAGLDIGAAARRRFSGACRRSRRCDEQARRRGVFRLCSPLDQQSARLSRQTCRSQRQPYADATDWRRRRKICRGTADSGASGSFRR